MSYRTAEQILTAQRDMLRDHIRDLELELAQAYKDLEATIEQLIKLPNKVYVSLVSSPLYLFLIIPLLS